MNVFAYTAQLRKRAAEQPTVMHDFDTDLHTDLQQYTVRFAEEIAGPTIGRSAVVDRLLDFRNLSRGRDLGLELTVDEMLEAVPASRAISSEWWLSCLSDITDHAIFLAAGYPPVVNESIAA